MIYDLTLYALTGAFAGIAAGLLGLGGGIIVVPALALIFAHLNMPESYIMHMSAATSLAVMIFTSAISTYSHNKRDAVRWKFFRQLVPGIILGTVLGIILASYLSSRVLEIIFGIFLLLVALRMFFQFQPKASRGMPGTTGTFSIATIVGMLSGMLGVGGGVLMVPLLSWYNVSMREAAGTAAACGLPIAIFGSLSAVYTGWHATTHLSYSTGFVYWPAALIIATFSMVFVFAGAKISKRLPGKTIKQIFAVVLFLVALDLLF